MHHGYKLSLQAAKVYLLLPLDSWKFSIIYSFAPLHFTCRAAFYNALCLDLYSLLTAAFRFNNYSLLENIKCSRLYLLAARSYNYTYLQLILGCT